MGNFILDNEERLNFALEAGELGYWELDFKTQELQYSGTFLKIFGFDGFASVSADQVVSRYTPESKILREQAHAESVKTGLISYYPELILPNGELRYLEIKGKVKKDADGHRLAAMGTAKNITAERTNTALLAESEQRFSTIANTAPVMIWMADTLKNCTFFNSEWLQFTGRQLAQELNMGWIESIHEDDVDRCVKVYDYAFSKQEQYYMEFRLKHHNDSYRWISLKATPRFSTKGNFEGYIGACMDINERILFEQKLQESESRLRIAALSSEMGTWDFNLQTQEIIWDAPMRGLFNISEDGSMTSDIFFDALHPDDVSMVQQAIEDVLTREPETYYDQEYRVKNKAAARGYIWVHAKGKIFFDESGRALRFSGTALNVTEKRIAIDELKEREANYRFMADAMPQFVWTSLPNGQINYFNEAVYKYSGKTVAQLDTQGWIYIVHPDDRSQNIKSWMHSIETGEPFLFEHRFQRYDGIYRWQLSRALPQLDENGLVKMWVGTSTDIDELKKHELQKDDFIKMANHELKTPVTTIKGYVQMLLKSHKNSDDAVLVTALSTVDKQVTKLTKLIGDLLDVTKIETGSLPINKEKFTLDDLVKETAVHIQTAFPTHTINIVQDDYCMVYADKDRINQVLVNLFTNAIKYSPFANEVTVWVKNEDNYAFVTIKDNGIGIAAEDHDKIFERFYRVAGKDEKTFPGFGIGLFIVKEIIQRHNGNIWVTSEKGKGSSFTFMLAINK